MNRNLRLEQMEERELMTVAVAFSTFTGLLRVTGSAAGEWVEINGTGVVGEVRVREVVDYVAVERGTYTGVRSMVFSMGAGDDSVNLSAIAISGSVVALGGLGADDFSLRDDATWGAEPDAPVFIGGSLSVNLGGHLRDEMNWYSRAGLGGTVARNVTVTGVNSAYLKGGGSGPAMESADLNIGGNLTVLLSGPSNGAFDATISSVNAYGSTFVRGSAFADSVNSGDSNFLGRVVVSLGGGDDAFYLDSYGANRFNSTFVVNFGAGNDTLVRRADNYFVVPMLTTGGPERVVY